MSARALVVRFGSLGDVVLTFAACAALRRGRPELEIAYLVKEAYAELVRAQPWAGEVIALPEGRAPGSSSVRARLRATRWQAVLDLQDNLRSRLLTRGLAGRTARWSKQGMRRRLWVWSRPLRRLGFGPAPIRSAWLRFADAAAGLGAAPPEPPTVEVPGEARQAADRLWRSWGVAQGESVVAIAPAAAHRTKEWPEHHVVGLAEHMAIDGHRVLVISTASERSRLAALDRWVAEQGGRALWLIAGLPEVAAALARARAVVACDSGLLHLAAAVGAPVVAVFGSTVPEMGFAPAGRGHRTVQRALPCRPCAVHGRRRCPLGHFACLEELVPHAVRHEVHLLLHRGSSRSVD